MSKNNIKSDVRQLLELMVNAEGCELLYSEIKDYYERLQDALDSDYASDYGLDFEFEGVEHRIIGKGEIDDIWTNSLIEQVKECYDLSDVPSFIAIDWNATAKACKVDGLGHHFNHYNGGELETSDFHVFRLGV